MREHLFRSRWILFAALTGFLSVLLGAASAHAMMSIQEERELGQKLLRTVEEQVTLIHDPMVTGYVQEVGRQVLKNVDDQFFDYHFYVIKDDGINAFAMPGGYIFVHSGLLETIDSEDELFCVLAHEIGHVQGRHIARNMDRMKPVNIATAAAAIAGLFLGHGGDTSSAVLVASGALNASLGLKYSRGDEEEADRRAVQWVCKAGFDPRGLEGVLKKMQIYRWLGADSIPSYLSTHPGTSERMTYLEDLWNRDPCPQKAPQNNFELHLVQVKLRVLTKDPTVLARRYRREIQATPKDVFLTYGLAEAQLEARDYEESVTTFKKLVAMAPQHPEFQVALGQALFVSGRYDEAQKTLRPYLDAHPRDDCARFYLGRAYQEAGDAEDALPLLRAVRTTWPDEDEILLQLGRTYAALKKDGEAHYYFYRYYQDIGNEQSAEYHRKKALALLKPDSELARDLQREDDENHKNGRDKKTPSRPKK